MKKFFETLIALMLHVGIVFIFSTWVFNKLVGYEAPEYIAFLASLWIFFSGLKMFSSSKPMTVIEMRSAMDDLKRGDNPVE